MKDKKYDMKDFTLQNLFDYADEELMVLYSKFDLNDLEKVSNAHRNRAISLINMKFICLKFMEIQNKK